MHHVHFAHGVNWKVGGWPLHSRTSITKIVMWFAWTPWNANELTCHASFLIHDRWWVAWSWNVMLFYWNPSSNSKNPKRPLGPLHMQPCSHKLMMQVLHPSQPLAKTWGGMDTTPHLRIPRTLVKCEDLLWMHSDISIVPIFHLFFHILCFLPP